MHESGPTGQGRVPGHTLPSAPDSMHYDKEISSTVIEGRGGKRVRKRRGRMEVVVLLPLKLVLLGPVLTSPFPSFSLLVRSSPPPAPTILFLFPIQLSLSLQLPGPASATPGTHRIPSPGRWPHPRPAAGPGPGTLSQCGGRPGAPAAGRRRRLCLRQKVGRKGGGPVKSYRIPKLARGRGARRRRWREGAEDLRAGGRGGASVRESFCMGRCASSIPKDLKGL